MLYATLTTGKCISGHIGDLIFRNNLRNESSRVTVIQADEDELARACSILGRNLPPVRVYQFLGVNAQEIAANF
jgi:hypothetical protein